MEGILEGVMEKSLYDVAAMGDTETVRDLNKKDQLLLERVSFTSPNTSPLHIATMYGRLSFVQAVLNHNRNLAEKLDSQQSSALHIASAKGYVKIVSVLVSVGPDMCFSRDCQGKTPLHIAVVKGYLEIVRELLLAAPGTCFSRDSQGRSPLHVAVVEGHVEIVSELLEAAPGMCFSRDSQGRNPLHVAVVEGHGPVLEKLVQVVPLAAREKVDRGVGLLHLCVKHKKFEALKFLMVNFNEMINDRDDDGYTVSHMADIDKQIETVEYLKSKSYKNVNAKNSEGEKKPPEKWRGSLMVVAILIATMAFQGIVSPPGGVWQDNQSSSQNQTSHIAGRAVMNLNLFILFMVFNTSAFALSLSTILLLISGLSLRNIYTSVLRVIMWLTIGSIGATYFISSTVITPIEEFPRRNLPRPIVGITVAVLCAVVVIISFCTVRLIHCLKPRVTHRHAQPQHV